MIFIRRYFIFAGIVSLIALSATTRADALRCGSNLVSDGDHFTEVLRICGNPEHVSTWVEYKTYPIEHDHYPFYTSGYGAVTIEEWIYNFGPNRFMQLLRFENGRLRKIKSLDYGY
jgi:hypothetical protein